MMSSIKQLSSNHLNQADVIQIVEQVGTGGQGAMSKDHVVQIVKQVVGVQMEGVVCVAGSYVSGSLPKNHALVYHEVDRLEFREIQEQNKKRESTIMRGNDLISPDIAKIAFLEACQFLSLDVALSDLAPIGSSGEFWA